MADKIQLPVTVPVFATYQYQGSGGAVAAANPSLYNWHLTHSVSLRCNRRFLKGLTTPQLSIPNTSLWDNPYLEKYAVGVRFTWDSRDKIIKRMLRAGYYVYFYGVDDYYVEGKSWYHERHAGHDGLICGLDEEQKTYSIFAYDQTWVYRVFQTPMKAFGRGLREMVKQNCFGELVALKAADVSVPLDLPALLSHLKDYLSSDFVRFPPEGEEDADGLVVHDYLCLYLGRLISGETPYERMDRRVMRVLWEHKRCMLDRIRAVEEAFQLSCALSDRYVPIEKTTNAMRMLYARYNRQRDDRLLLSLQEKLQHIKDEETAILQELVAAMERVAVSDHTDASA